MWKEKNPKFGVSLMLAAMICLSSCKTIDYKHNCPVYPIAGEKVAKELAEMSYTDYPNTWEWLARINKLRLELESCQKIRM